MRDPPEADGMIDIDVENGVVTLDGEVTGAGQRRTAGVLA